MDESFYLKYIKAHYVKTFYKLSEIVLYDVENRKP